MNKPSSPTQSAAPQAGAHAAQTEPKTFLQFLDTLPAFHHLVRWLRLRQMAALVLKTFPRVRSLPGSGARYRCRYLETLLLSDEIFHRNVYDRAIDPKLVTNFADLGCNVGLFAVLLLHRTGRRDLKGIMVDANPDMTAETQWNLSANQLDNVFPLYGLVGATTDAKEADFYLLPSNLGSSQFPVYEPGKPPKGDWKKLTVPRIDLETAWLKHCGDVRCHVLKVDIEGSEGKLLKTDRAFFKRVDTIILEWHKWIVSREEVETLLKEQGFELVEVFEELEQSGIAWYARPARAAAQAS